MDPTCLALHNRQIRIILIYLLLDFYAAAHSTAVLQNSQILSIVTCSSWNLAACASNSTYYRLSNMWTCSWFSMKQVLHQHHVGCRGWNQIVSVHVYPYCRVEYRGKAPKTRAKIISTYFNFF